MEKTAPDTTRFRKNLKQFLDLKQSGKLNGKAAVVEQKLKTAAEIAGLNFDEELNRFAVPSVRENPVKDLFCGLECIQDDDEIRENRAPKPEELYQTITDQIISLITSNKKLPWQHPWKQSGEYPHGGPTNYVSKKPYRGINAILLAFTKIVKNKKGEKERVLGSFNSPYFLTAKQIEAKGGTIKEGAVGQFAFYFSQIYKHEQDDPKKLSFSTFDRDDFIQWLQENRSDIPLLGTFSPQQLADQSTLPLLRYYNIFNGDDIEGIEFKKLAEPEQPTEEERIKNAELIYEHYPNAPELQSGGNQAAYYPTMDVIKMPEFKQFTSPQKYYSVLYHEAVHSTGHSSRLNRGNDTRNRDGSAEDKKAYNFEELVAELGAAFLSGEAGILFHTRDNSAAYLKGYRERLLTQMNNDSRFFFRATSRAQAAADYILDRDDEGNPAYYKKLGLDEKPTEAKETEEKPVAEEENENSQKSPKKGKAKFKIGDKAYYPKKDAIITIKEVAKPKKNTPFYGIENRLYRIQFESGKKAMGIPESLLEPVENAQKEESPGTITVIKGKPTSVDFKADGSEKQKGTWQLFEADDLTASHHKDCSANSKHRISRGQPRDRSLDNLCAQPKFIAKNLNPDSITRGNLAFNGAPVALPDGMIIQGNGRTIALKIAHNEIPGSARKYIEFLEENAGEFGFKKSDVTAMQQPVLVRVLPVSDKEAVRLGNITDTSQAKMSRIDQAKALIRNLKPNQLESIGRIIGSSEGETIGAIIDDIGINIFDQVKDLDRTGLVEKNGLTADGKEFLRSMLTGLIFDSDKHTSALRDFLDNSRTVQAGLERSYGYIIPLIGQEADIREKVQEAVQITAEIKRNNAFNSVSDVMSAQDMFSGKKEFSQQGQDLATFLLESTTQKAIRDGFRSYRDHIKGREDLFNPIEAQPQPQAFEAAFIKRENPPEHIVKLRSAGEFKKGDVIRDYYDDEKYVITSFRKNKVYTKEVDSGKRQVFRKSDKRFLPNRPETPTLPLFGDVRENFTVRLFPKMSNRQTKRFLNEATQAEKGMVRAMVSGQDYHKFLKNLDETQTKKFLQNLAFRLGLFRDDGESIWLDYVNRPITEFSEAIEMEAKKMFSDEPRQNPNHTDIRLVKPKYQFKTAAEAWKSVAETTGLTPADVEANHSKKSWKWKRKPSARKNPEEKEIIKDYAAKYQTVVNDIAKGGSDLSTDELTALNRKKLDILNELEETVDHRKYGVRDAFDLIEPHLVRPNPGKKITLVMLGVAEEIEINQGNGNIVSLHGPHAMVTNTKKDTLFVVPFNKLKKLPKGFTSTEANKVYEMWHNFKPDNNDFEMSWPAEEPKPVGWAHSILYASDKVLREWDAKGKLNLYEHDFDPAKRPAFKKGGILLITNLEIDERGILN